MNTTSPTSTPDLLAELLAALPPVPKKPKQAKPARRALIPNELPLEKAYAARRTGYVTWKATHRVLQVQRSICSCCGEEVSYIKNEFFALENGTAQATWLRHEGYGIDAPEDLPNVFVDLPEPIYTTACPTCRSTPFDDLESLLHPRQLSFTL